MIDNPRSDRVRRLVALFRRSARLKQGLLLVEGPQAVREACIYAADYLRDIYYLPDRPELAEVLQLARQATKWLHPVSVPVVKQVAPSSQGIFATVDLAGFPTLQGEFPTAERGAATGQRTPTEALSAAEQTPQVTPSPAAQASKRLPTIPAKGTAESVQAKTESLFAPGRFSLLLPRIQDPGNLGSLLRIADAFGAQQVLVCKGSCDPAAPKVIRASAGSFFHLPIYAGLDFPQLAQLASSSGAQLVGADAHQAQDLDSFLARVPQQQHLLLVFGNEAQGFSAPERQLLHHRVQIPLAGRAESLNVSAAAAVICYQVSRFYN